MDKITYAILKDMGQVHGPHAKEGEAYEPQRARIKAYEKRVDDERLADKEKSGFVCQKR